jgi:hypothetical protein
VFVAAAVAALAVRPVPVLEPLAADARSVRPATSVATRRSAGAAAQPEPHRAAEAARTPILPPVPGPGAACGCGDAQAVDVPMADRRTIIVISDAVGEQVRWASPGTPGRGGARRAG